MTEVTDDADDRGPGIVAREIADLDPFAQGVLVGEGLAGQRLVDDHYQIGGITVQRENTPPLEHRHADGSEIIRRDHLIMHVELLASRTGRLALDADPRLNVPAALRNPLGRTRRFHARQCLNPLEQGRIEVPPLVLRGVPGAW